MNVLLVYSSLSFSKLHARVYIGILDTSLLYSLSFLLIARTELTIRYMGKRGTAKLAYFVE